MVAQALACDRGTSVPLRGSEAKASRGLKPALHAVFVVFVAHTAMSRGTKWPAFLLQAKSARFSARSDPTCRQLEWHYTAPLEIALDSTGCCSLEIGQLQYGEWGPERQRGWAKISLDISAIFL
jgi:hypothetical protein